MAVATQRPLDLAGALCADGPHSEHEDALMLFGQFVGGWEGGLPDALDLLRDRGAVVSLVERLLDRR
jgi:hypothetical protein